MTRQGEAAKPFDLATCQLDVAPVRAARALRDLTGERGKPPPVMTRIARVDRRDAAATATALAAALPGTWKPTIELDVSGMASVVEVHVPGSHTTLELAADVLGFVRARPCLFGIVEPAALDAHVIGAQHQGTWVLFDVRPRSVGVIQADVESEGDTTRVRIEGHLWPIADATPAIDEGRMLARYLGLGATIHAGERYMVDPATHRHTGCVPIYRDVVTEPATFRVQPGPILACRARTLEVVAGAVVSLPSMKPGHDPVLDELPAALDPDGNRITPYLAPAMRSPDQDDLFWGAAECAP
jgi:hypothetical protein